MNVIEPEPDLVGDWFGDDGRGSEFENSASKKLRTDYPSFVLTESTEVLSSLTTMEAAAIAERPIRIKNLLEERNSHFSIASTTDCVGNRTSISSNVNFSYPNPDLMAREMLRQQQEIDYLRIQLDEAEEERRLEREIAKENAESQIRNLKEEVRRLKEKVQPTDTFSIMTRSIRSQSQSSELPIKIPIDLLVEPTDTTSIKYVVEPTDTTSIKYVVEPTDTTSIKLEDCGDEIENEVALMSQFMERLAKQINPSVYGANSSYNNCLDGNEELEKEVAAMSHFMEQISKHMVPRASLPEEEVKIDTIIEEDVSQDMDKESMSKALLGLDDACKNVEKVAMDNFLNDLEGVCRTLAHQLDDSRKECSYYKEIVIPQQEKQETRSNRSSRMIEKPTEVPEIGSNRSSRTIGKPTEVPEIGSNRSSRTIGKPTEIPEIDSNRSSRKSVKESVRELEVPLQQEILTTRNSVVSKASIGIKRSSLHHSIPVPHAVIVDETSSSSAGKVGTPASDESPSNSQVPASTENVKKKRGKFKFW